jgi:hypothetical protein
MPNPNPANKRKLSDSSVRKLLLAKIRELIKEADRYAELDEDAWVTVYLKSAMSLANAIRENYPAGVK